MRSCCFCLYVGDPLTAEGALVGDIVNQEDTHGSTVVNYKKIGVEC